MVVCSVLPVRALEAVGQLSLAPEGCDLVELRADHLRADEIASVVRESPRELIVTIRRKEDGGGFDGSETEREHGIRSALEAGARFVDVEWDGALTGLIDEPGLGSSLILSSHGVRCDDRALLARYLEMRGRFQGPLKIVAEATSVDQNLAVRRLLDAARSDGGALTAFAMGPAGAASRILASSWGSWATYGSLSAGEETAAGQFTAAEMLEDFEVLRIGRETSLYGLVGARVGRSPSPGMHAAAYRETGQDARYLSVETDSLDAFASLVDPRQGLGIVGFGVTIPFKEQAAARCVLADEASEASRAVNTVIVDGQNWRGFNTDGAGVLARLKTRIAPEGRRAAVIGAGGTALGVAFELVRAGCEVTLFNRTLERARVGARRVGAGAAALEQLPGSAWDLLINATPLGSSGERFLDPSSLRGRVVVDAVYSDEPTALVRDARSRGLEVIDGLEMLAAQGVLQFRQMTGVDVPFEVMHAAVAPRDSGGAS